MNTEIFDRLRREIALTVEGARETVFSIADRVNRKTQAIKLHWHAAELTRQLALTHRQIGALVTETLAFGEASSAGYDAGVMHKLQGRLEEHAATLRLLKQDLGLIDRRIAEIEAENLSDNLLRFQVDLTERSLCIERVAVAPEAPVVGMSLESLVLSPGTRVIAAFRGPVVLSAQLVGGLRAGDIVLLLGSRLDLQDDRLQFIQRQQATA